MRGSEEEDYWPLGTQQLPTGVYQIKNTTGNIYLFRFA